MAFKITDECLACGTCLDSCPNGAIEEGEIFKITTACEDCGTCVDMCPTGAIIEE
ncbi:4Fe-4S binding protein [Desulforamulus aquiferis]|uniref:4Fe-4S binding protein n=1 Tax=Desulforamulus aquiferis TaxID=1397668 RepID=A0AAW7ZCT4_9FIRM|nr:4Fe-4S binding protein [Desulforamulus aquiferis]MDO7787060.1 4Fe-4S binding protein [Desulforamulus aquiferis]RYD06581.1 ferredoxin [Desulforamulus aquiferis]